MLSAKDTPESADGHAALMQRHTSPVGFGGMPWHAAECHCQGCLEEFAYVRKPIVRSSSLSPGILGYYTTSSVTSTRAPSSAQRSALLGASAPKHTKGEDKKPSADLLSWFLQLTP